MIRIYNIGNTNTVGKLVIGGDSCKFITPPIGEYVELEDDKIHGARILVDNSFGRFSFNPPVAGSVVKTPSVVNELQAEIERLKAQLAEKETPIVEVVTELIDAPVSEKKSKKASNQLEVVE